MTGDQIGFIVWNERPAEMLAKYPDLARTNRPHYSCHVQPRGEQVDAAPEDGPDTAVLDEALAWVRSRTEEVYVRPQWDSGRHYLATDAPPETWQPHD